MDVAKSFLDVLADSVASGALEMDVIVSCGGTVVTGRMVPITKYLDRVGEQFMASVDNAAQGFGQALRDAARGDEESSAEASGPKADEERKAETSGRTIYLVDAQVFGGTDLWPADSSGSWACRTSSVDAFSFGRISKQTG